MTLTYNMPTKSKKPVRQLTYEEMINKELGKQKRYPNLRWVYIKNAFPALIKLSEEITAITPDQEHDLHLISTLINEGGWDGRTGAAHTMNVILKAIESGENNRYTPAGMHTEKAVEAELLELRQNIYNTAVERVRSRNLTPGSDEETYANTSLEIIWETLVAASVRDCAGDQLFPEWTMKRYDHITRPWRTVINSRGIIVEGDATIPKSWAKRPLTWEQIQGLRTTDAIRTATQITTRVNWK